MEKYMKEILSIIADVATIVTALCATGILVKINVNIKDSENKKANQIAKGKSNNQKISQ
jgi:hypothetical protein